MLVHRALASNQISGLGLGLGLTGLCIRASLHKSSQESPRDWEHLDPPSRIRLLLALI